MKKIFYLLLPLMVIFAGCGNSINSQIEDEISSMIKESLYKPDTYKAVSTKIDSAFTPYDNPELISKTIEYNQYLNGNELERLNECAEKVARYSDSRNWGSYFKYEYEEAKKEYDAAKSQYDKMQDEQMKRLLAIRGMLQEEKRFIGYKAFHNYRADNNLGYTTIGNAVFVFDINKNMKYYFEKASYDNAMSLLRSGDIELLITIDSLENVLDN